MYRTVVFLVNFYTTLTLNIYMTIIPSNLLTCAIFCGLPQLDYISGFNDLVWKIIVAKIDENCKKKVIFFYFHVIFLPKKMIKSAYQI